MRLHSVGKLFNPWNYVWFTLLTLHFWFQGCVRIASETKAAPLCVWWPTVYQLWAKGIGVLIVLCVCLRWGGSERISLEWSVTNIVSVLECKFPCHCVWRGVGVDGPAGDWLPTGRFLTLTAKTTVSSDTEVVPVCLLCWLLIKWTGIAWVRARSRACWQPDNGGGNNGQTRAVCSYGTTSCPLLVM